MTHAKFNFNQLMLTLIFGIWASEPLPRARRTTEKAGFDGVKRKCEKCSTTSYHQPLCPQMILEIFQTQEFGQDRPCHFAGFQSHFCLNMISQTQCCKRMKKMKVQYLGTLLYDLFETLQAIRT